MEDYRAQVATLSLNFFYSLYLTFTAERACRGVSRGEEGATFNLNRVSRCALLSLPHSARGRPVGDIPKSENRLVLEFFPVEKMV